MARIGGKVEDTVLAGDLSGLSLAPSMPSHGMRCYLAARGMYPIPSDHESLFSRTARLLEDAARENEPSETRYEPGGSKTGHEPEASMWSHVPPWAKDAKFIATFEKTAMSNGYLKGKCKVFK